MSILIIMVTILDYPEHQCSFTIKTSTEILWYIKLQWMATNDNEWQRMTMSGIANDNEWQQVTTYDPCWIKYFMQNLRVRYKDCIQNS